MAPPDAHAALSVKQEPYDAAPAPSLPSTAASALSVGEKSVENAPMEVEKPRVAASSAAGDASSSTVVVKAVASVGGSGSDTGIPAAAVDVTSAGTGTSLAAGAPADDADDTGDRREDGYVTPPLRTGYVTDYTKQQQQLQPSPLSSQTPDLCKPQGQGMRGISTGPSYTKLAPRESYQHPLGIFTPILFATQSLGGILSPTGNKRKRIEPNGPILQRAADDVASGKGDEDKATTPRRKVSSDYLRKGQWTVTEEKFARALIDAFEEGYLPIYTGIRLRGYLAVQLQCDPMRISKKLCGGSVDGKKIPKNYGQKKFKLRKKQVWNQEEAGKILVNLEKLMRELWSESGVPQPTFLTLSSTRNADEETFTSSNQFPVSMSRADGALPSPDQDCSSTSRSTSPVPKKPTTDNAAFPIIYLNLSKKHKRNDSTLPSNTTSSSSSRSTSKPCEGSKPLQASESVFVSTQRADDGPHRKARSAESAASQDWKVDGDSLQAAYELLNLFQA